MPERDDLSEQFRVRPNPRRQLLYVVIAVAAIFTGYFAVTVFNDFGTPPKKVATASKPQASTAPQPAPEPWYKKQAPPPTLITTPNLPLFPEEEEEKIAPPDRARAYEEAYEEALPRDIYRPPLPKPAEKTGPAAVVAAVPPVAADISGLPAWRRYALPAPDTGAAPVIALVIDDMGVDVKRTARISALAGPMTMSFLTYGRNLAEQTARATGNGHELMLHVSMEPSSKAVDPGPNVLLTGLDEQELRRRLDWGFGRFQGYIGVNNHMGSKFTSDENAMRLVLEEIRRRGLLFMDSRTSAKTVGARLARRMGVPFVERNVFLDHVNEVAAVNRQLAEVEAVARRQGYAVAIGHPREATIKALEPWLADIEKRGFRLVPLSAVVKRLEQFRVDPNYPR